MTVASEQAKKAIADADTATRKSFEETVSAAQNHLRGILQPRTSPRPKQMPWAAASALPGALLIEAAAGAADRALRTVFDTEAHTALEQALAHGEVGERPPQWDDAPDEPVTWMVRERHEVRMVTQAALEAELSSPCADNTTNEDPRPPGTAIPHVGGVRRRLPRPHHLAQDGRAGPRVVWCPQWWRHAEAIGWLMACGKRGSSPASTAARQ